MLFTLVCSRVCICFCSLPHSSTKIPVEHSHSNKAVLSANPKLIDLQWTQSSHQHRRPHGPVCDVVQPKLLSTTNTPNGIRCAQPCRCVSARDVKTSKCPVQTEVFWSSPAGLADGGASCRVVSDRLISTATMMETLQQIQSGKNTKLVFFWIQNERKQRVVISQTRWLVSQERLSPRVGTSVFIMYTVLPAMRQWFKFTAGVSHHTPPPPGGAGLYRQF